MAILVGPMPYCKNCGKPVNESGCTPDTVLTTGFAIIKGTRYNVSYCISDSGQEATK